MHEHLRDLFLLRPEIAFLNHGSFGACPRPVFEHYQQWQREMEEEPVEFHGRRAPELLRHARKALGEYLNTDPDDLVYVVNATTGANIVARSLQLGPGDEILTTDHEYGACDRMWRFLTERNGATYRSVTIPIPVTDQSEFVERFFEQVGPRTRVIFMSHITAPTALTFPVAEICRRARALGIITLIDGAHAPGQIPLDLRELDADFYTGNLHKWLCAPKGAAFLYARRSMQPLLEPLVVSWGWEPVVGRGSTFIDHHEYYGTSDISAPLSVPAAIDFHRQHDWDAVRLHCHDLLLRARPSIAEALDAVPTAPDGGGWFAQMSSFLLPSRIDGAALQAYLFNEHGVEIPIFDWNGRQTIRISVQGYNRWEDIERLLLGCRAFASGETAIG